MGDVAASGGYYVSMGANKILVEPGTLTGSIGVVGGKIALHGLMDKVGITSETISRGKNSGTLSMVEPFTADERAAWKRLMQATYEQFTGKAAKGRKMDPKKLEELAGGRVFTGRQAVANGLADQIGTLDDAIAEAKNMAGIKPDEKVDIWMLPKPKGMLEQLLGGSSAEAEAARSRRALRSLEDGPHAAQAVRRAGRDRDALQREVQIRAAGECMMQDQEQLNLLSVFHYVVGGILGFFSLFPCIHVAFGLAILFMPQLFHGKEGPPSALLGWLFLIVGLSLITLGWTMAVLILLAGRFLARQALFVLPGRRRRRMPLHAFRHRAWRSSRLWS